MTGGNSVGSWGSGWVGAPGLSTEGFLVVAGRFVGFFGRGLWVDTSPIRRNRTNAEMSPTPAFMVLREPKNKHSRTPNRPCLALGLKPTIPSE